MKKQARINIKALEELKKYIGSDGEPTHFFTMTEINKVGINPQSRYNTPLGIYAYPLTSEYYNHLIKASLPFAGNKPYINLFTIKDNLFNVNDYDRNTLSDDIEKLRNVVSLDMDTAEKAFKEAKLHANNSVAKFWNLTRIISKDSMGWNALLRKLGYTNFYDPGSSLIHPSEPTQILILDPRIISIVESFLNPYAIGNENYKTEKYDESIIKQKTRQKLNLLDHLHNYNENVKGLDEKIKYLVNFDNVNILSNALKFNYKNIKPETASYIINYLLNNKATHSGEDIIRLFHHHNKLTQDDKNLIANSNQPKYLDLIKYDDSVGLLVANNPNSDIGSLYFLIIKSNDSKTAQAAYNNFAHKLSAYELINLAQTIEIKPLLYFLSNDKDEKIRHAARENPTYKLLFGGNVAPLKSSEFSDYVEASLQSNLKKIANKVNLFQSLVTKLSFNIE
jgi:hypothetical protein